VKCPHCSEKTRVIDTRMKCSTRAKVWVNRNIPAFRDKKDLDWRYRKRVCNSCEKISYSIEYIVSDLNKLFKEQTNEKKSNIPKH